MTQQVWFVSAAHGRYEVSDVVFDQRARLIGGLTAWDTAEYHSLVVADDENLDIAQSFGFEILDHPNLPLADKWNAGFHQAMAEGATHIVYIGSDDLVHAGFFDGKLPVDMRIITGRRIAFLDAQAGRMLPCSVNTRWGVVPWIIPAQMLRRAGARPIQTRECRGMDGSLMTRLRQTTRPITPELRDPHPLCRVDVKSAMNINAYDRITDLACGEEVTDPWPLLAEFYPVDLVERLRALSEVTV